MNLNSDPSRRRFLRQTGAAGLTFNIMKTSTALGSEANSKVEAEAFRSLLPAMLASYDSDSNLPSRRWGATSLFKKATPEFADS